MQTNLVFLCGPHGSGKTTLINRLREINPALEVPQLYSRNIKFNIADEFQRQSLKIAARAIENFEYLSAAKNSPDKVVLGNRCVYDVLAYTQSYFNLGWLDAVKYTGCMQVIFNLFLGDLNNPRAIILNPGFEVCLRHLEKRWSEKGKKWREGDMEYLREVVENFKTFRNKDNILYLDREFCLNDRNQIDYINEWLKPKSQ
jgi:thymidylate kinase